MCRTRVHRRIRLIAPEREARRLNDGAGQGFRASDKVAQLRQEVAVAQDVIAAGSVELEDRCRSLEPALSSDQ